jgi:hypothetical protein
VGGRLLTGEQVLSRVGGLNHLRKGETLEAVRMTYRQLHAANPELASASRLGVKPDRAMWAITWHFSPPIPYQPCRYASCPAVAAVRTIRLAASSTLIDARTGQTTDSCTGCAAVPAPRGDTGTLRGELAVCCNAHGSMPEAGIVVLKRIGGGSRWIAVNRTGHFSLALPVGRYNAEGGIPQLHWPLGQCLPERQSSSAPPASPIVIERDVTTRTSIVCQGQ